MPPKRRRKQKAPEAKCTNKKSDIPFINRLPNEILTLIIQFEPALSATCQRFNQLIKPNIFGNLASPPYLCKDTMTYNFDHQHNTKFNELIVLMNSIKVLPNKKIYVRQIALSLRDDYYFLALQFLLNCFTYTPNMVLYDVKPDKLRYLYSRGIEDLTIFPSEFHNYLFWLPYRFPNLKKLQLHFKIPVDGNINLSNNCDGQSITNDFFDCWLCGFNAKTHKQLNTIVLLGYRPRAPRTVYSSFAANNIMPDFFTNENLLYQARVYVVGDGRLFKVQDEGLKVRKLAEIYGWANDIDTVCDHLRNCYITGVDNK